jgi:hypothetical protein
MTSFDWKSNYKSLYPPLEREQIKQCEEVLGKRIPEELVQFLLLTNGAFFVDLPQFDYLCSDYTPSKLVTVSFKIICGISPDPEVLDVNSLPDAQVGLEFDKCVPAKFLAMGYPMHHAVLCMSTEGRDTGMVYLWEPPVIFEECDEPSMEDVYPVAKGLFAFLESLTPEPLV